MRKSSLLLTLVLFVSLLSIAPVSYAAIVVPAPGTSTPAKEPDATTINAAFEEFRSLSNKEKKARFKELKKEFKAFKKAKKKDSDISTNTLLLAIIAILLPPLAVFLHQGEINTKFWISLLLCFLAIVTFFLWIIPVLYAILVVLNVF
jgi:uncharacterized membrane protein YqaE (UPF0057 family)